MNKTIQGIVESINSQDPVEGFEVNLIQQIETLGHTVIKQSGDMACYFVILAGQNNASIRIDFINGKLMTVDIPGLAES